MPSNDPFFGHVVALLHMDDTALSDAKGHAVTRTGNATRSSAQFRFGGHAAFFDGSTDSLYFAASADFAFGTAPFTLEAWVYLAGNSPPSGSTFR